MNKLLKKKRMLEYTTDDVEISYGEENSDEEKFNEKKLNTEIFLQVLYSVIQTKNSRI